MFVFTGRFWSLKPVKPKSQTVLRRGFDNVFIQGGGKEDREVEI